MAYMPSQPLSFGAFGEQAVTLKRAQAILNFAYNINAAYAVATTAAGGAVAQSNGRAQLDPGVGAGGRARVSSLRRLVYQPGRGGTVRFTAVFGTPDANNRQVIGLGDDANGLFFGYDGVSFGILRRSAGVDTWTPQANWNRDPCDGSGLMPAIDFSAGVGNIFQIVYQWLGYGAIRFFVEHPTLGRFVPVHVIEYANTSAEVSFRNPSLPLVADSFNVGGASGAASVLQTPSMGAFADFPDTSLGPLRGTRNLKNFGTGVITNIFTIRNDATFQGVPNQTPLRMAYWSGALDGNQIAEFRLIRNATLGGAPVFNPLDANESPVSVDVAGTTVAAGRLLIAEGIGVDNGFGRVLEEMRIELDPGETLTLAAEKLAGAAGNHAGSLSWREVFF